MLQIFRYTRTVKGVNVNVSIIVGDEKNREPWEVKLSRLPEFHFDHRYANGGVAIQSLSLAHPDVVLLDCDLPDMTGIECLRHLAPVMRGYHVILVGSAPGPDDLVLVQAISCGASGFLTRPVTPQELGAAMRLAHAGGFVLNASAAQRLGSLLTQTPRSLHRHALLTRREEGIMNLVLMSASDKEIASRFGISAGTVHSHFTNIFKKLRVNSRLDAARKLFGTQHLLASNLREHRLHLQMSSNRPGAKPEKVQAQAK